MNEYLKQIVSVNQTLIAEIKEQNDNHNKQFNVLSAGLKSVNSRITSLEATNCCRSVNIIGVPFVKDESMVSLFKIVKKICGVLKVTFSEKDIDDIYRIGKEKKIIKVDLTTKIRRREFIKAARTTKISGKDIGF